MGVGSFILTFIVAYLLGFVSCVALNRWSQGQRRKNTEEPQRDSLPEEIVATPVKEKSKADDRRETSTSSKDVYITLETLEEYKGKGYFSSGNDPKNALFSFVKDDKALEVYSLPEGTKPKDWYHGLEKLGLSSSDSKLTSFVTFKEGAEWDASVGKLESLSNGGGYKVVEPLTLTIVKSERMSEKQSEESIQSPEEVEMPQEKNRLLYFEEIKRSGSLIKGKGERTDDSCYVVNLDDSSVTLVENPREDLLGRLSGNRDTLGYKVSGQGTKRAEVCPGKVKQTPDGWTIVEPMKITLYEE